MLYTEIIGQTGSWQFYSFLLTAVLFWGGIIFSQFWFSGLVLLLSGFTWTAIHIAKITSISMGSPLSVQMTDFLYPSILTCAYIVLALVGKVMVIKRRELLKEIH